MDRQVTVSPHLEFYSITGDMLTIVISKAEALAMRENYRQSHPEHSVQACQQFALNFVRSVLMKERWEVRDEWRESRFVETLADLFDGVEPDGEIKIGVEYNKINPLTEDARTRLENCREDGKINAVTTIIMTKTELQVNFARAVDRLGNVVQQVQGGVLENDAMFRRDLPRIARGMESMKTELFYQDRRDEHTAQLLKSNKSALDEMFNQSFASLSQLAASPWNTPYVPPALPVQRLPSRAPAPAPAAAGPWHDGHLPYAGPAPAAALSAASRASAAAQAQAKQSQLLSRLAPTSSAASALPRPPASGRAAISGGSSCHLVVPSVSSRAASPSTGGSALQAREPRLPATSRHPATSWPAGGGQVASAGSAAGVGNTAVAGRTWPVPAMPSAVPPSQTGTPRVVPGTAFVPGATGDDGHAVAASETTSAQSGVRPSGVPVPASAIDRNAFVPLDSGGEASVRVSVIASGQSRSHQSPGPSLSPTFRPLEVAAMAEVTGAIPVHELLEMLNRGSGISSGIGIGSGGGASLSPPTSTASIPPTSTASIPPTSTAGIPPTSTAGIPPTTTAGIPPTSTAGIPPTSTASIPPTSTASIPPTSTASIPPAAAAASGGTGVKRSATGASLPSSPAAAALHASRGPSMPRAGTPHAAAGDTPTSSSDQDADLRAKVVAAVYNPSNRAQALPALVDMSEEPVTVLVGSGEAAPSPADDFVWNVPTHAKKQQDGLALLQQVYVLGTEDWFVKGRVTRIDETADGGEKITVALKDSIPAPAGDNTAGGAGTRVAELTGCNLTISDRKTVVNRAELKLGMAVVGPYDRTGQMYSGVVAEMSCSYNRGRFLIFFDDGFARYISHSNLYPIIRTGDSQRAEQYQRFLEGYLREVVLSEGIMVEFQVGKTLLIEWKCHMIKARVVNVDASLVEVQYLPEANRRNEDLQGLPRMESIYRGSMRLSPVLKAREAAEAKPNILQRMKFTFHSAEERFSATACGAHGPRALGDMSMHPSPQARLPSSSQSTQKGSRKLKKRAEKEKQKSSSKSRSEQSKSSDKQRSALPASMALVTDDAGQQPRSTGHGAPSHRVDSSPPLAAPSPAIMILAASDSDGERAVAAARSSSSRSSNGRTSLSDVGVARASDRLPDSYGLEQLSRSPSDSSPPPPPPAATTTQRAPAGIASVAARPAQASEPSGGRDGARFAKPRGDPLAEESSSDDDDDDDDDDDGFGGAARRPRPRSRSSAFVNVGKRRAGGERPAPQKSASTAREVDFNEDSHYTVGNQRGNQRRNQPGQQQPGNQPGQQPGNQPGNLPGYLPDARVKPTVTDLKESSTAGFDQRPVFPAPEAPPPVVKTRPTGRATGHTSAFRSPAATSARSSPVTVVSETSSDSANVFAPPKKPGAAFPRDRRESASSGGRPYDDGRILIETLNTVFFDPEYASIIQPVTPITVDRRRLSEPSGAPAFLAPASPPRSSSMSGLPKRASASTAATAATATTATTGATTARLQPQAHYRNARSQRQDAGNEAYEEHTCNVGCTSRSPPGHADIRDSVYRATNHFARPLLLGWRRERRLPRVDSRRQIPDYSYLAPAPCLRRLRSMEEIEDYLHVTGTSNVTVDQFSLDGDIRLRGATSLPGYTLLVRDISGDQEKVSIGVMARDTSVQLPDFHYSSTVKYKSVRPSTDPGFLVCCSCTDGCRDKERCECQQLSKEAAVVNHDKSSYSYTQRRKQTDTQSGIYECNSQCQCSQTCSNRLVQHGIQLRLVIFHAATAKGWGIFCLDDIPKGSFVCTYVGKLLTEEEGNEAGKLYGDEYFAALDHIEICEREKAGYESTVEMPMELQSSFEQPPGIEMHSSFDLHSSVNSSAMLSSMTTTPGSEVRMSDDGDDEDDGIADDDSIGPGPSDRGSPLFENLLTTPSPASSAGSSIRNVFTMLQEVSDREHSASDRPPCSPASSVSSAQFSFNPPLPPQETRSASPAKLPSFRNRPPIKRPWKSQQALARSPRRNDTVTPVSTAPTSATDSPPPGAAGSDDGGAMHSDGDDMLPPPSLASRWTPTARLTSPPLMVAGGNRNRHNTARASTGGGGRPLAPDNLLDDVIVIVSGSEEDEDLSHSASGTSIDQDSRSRVMDTREESRSGGGIGGTMSQFDEVRNKRRADTSLSDSTSTPRGHAGMQQQQQQQQTQARVQSTASLSEEEDVSAFRCTLGDRDPIILDAKKVGNVGRFINHSCDANLFVQNILVETHDLRYPTVAFFALRNIRAGTELTWPYGYEAGSVKGKTMNCLCGSSNCRGRLL